MKVFTSIGELQTCLISHKKSGEKIGFIPTMGALHDGHLSLVQQAQKQCAITVVSVFVNPTQFNNPDDLKKYPRNLESDTALLAKIGCDYVFAPSVDEVYPTNLKAPILDLGSLDKVMEGEFRPGHFKGVVQVVHRLFDIVKPDFAYFGKKDFQQLSVIRFMTRELNLPVQIVGCETSRESSGLAMSSRNMRLTDKQREQATIIFKTLELCKSSTSFLSPAEVKRKAIHFFQEGTLELEYLDIVNPRTLESLNSTWVDGATACIAAYCGEVRLIDNMELIPVLVTENK